MARRTGNNVVGDLNELNVAKLLLEHGIAINALTASDTGWDLHCHIPDDLLCRASESGSGSWSLSGRTVHVQVKSSSSGQLRVGTVRGWLSGTLSGVPTFMFVHKVDEPVFATPANLRDWLPRAVNDEDAHGYTLTGNRTAKQSPLHTLRYRERRFPSVLKFWIEHPGLALAYGQFTKWINGEIGRPDESLDSLVQELIVAVWAADGVTRDTDPSTLRNSLSGLYEAAGFDDYVQRAENYLVGIELHGLTLGDNRVSWHSVDRVIASAVHPENTDASAIELLRDLNRLHDTDAANPS
ncbi:hypothetical protein [Gordonia sihwensis]|uniref:hypothetical protein n=1 Tax=Gordonia sihwensis TaxID=173559 RepID=UPI003D969C5A